LDGSASSAPNGLTGQIVDVVVDGTVVWIATKSGLFQVSNNIATRVNDIPGPAYLLRKLKGGDIWYSTEQSTFKKSQGSKSFVEVLGLEPKAI
jgi:hypothetical protein